MKKSIRVLILTLFVCNILSAQISQISDFEFDNVFSSTNTTTTAATGTNYFFVANNENGKEELWKTNGSKSGTIPLLTFEFIAQEYRISKMTPYKGSVAYFFELDGEEQLYFYRPDLEGSIALSGLNGGEIFGTFIAPFVYKDLIYFSYFTAQDGEEIWYSDGLSNTPKLLKDIAPGSISSSFRFPFIFNDLMYFFAREDVFDGNALWSSDGTSSGTQMVKLLNSNGSSNVVEALGNDGSTIFMAMQNGFSDDLYVSDGTSSGTKFIAEVSDGVKEMVVAKGKAYFTVNDGDDEVNVWVSDGTAVGTKVLSNFDDIGNRAPFSLTVFEDNVYFFGYTSGDLQLVKVDSGTDGITFLKTFSSSSTSVQRGITNVGNEMLLVAREDFDDGYEIFKSDGTVDGTKRLADLNTQYSESSSATDIEVFSTGDVVFKAEKITGNRELFYYRKSNYQPFSFTLDNPGIDCFGGVATVTAAGLGGTPPYIFQWSSPLGVDNQLVDAGPGAYSVVISDQNGDSYVEEFELIEPDSLMLESLIVTPATGNNADGTASIAISGGITPYTYAWSNGATEKDVDGLLAGEYKVIVKDANDCTFEVTVAIDMVSSIKELMLDISIRPSFVDEILTIDTKGRAQNLTYQISSTSGVVMRSGPLVNNYIDVVELPKGSYILTLYSAASNASSAKFVKF